MNAWHFRTLTLCSARLLGAWSRDPCMEERTQSLSSLAYPLLAPSICSTAGAASIARTLHLGHNVPKAARLLQFTIDHELAVTRATLDSGLNISGQPAP